VNRKKRARIVRGKKKFKCSAGGGGDVVWLLQKGKKDPFSEKEYGTSASNHKIRKKDL